MPAFLSHSARPGSFASLDNCSIRLSGLLVSKYKAASPAISGKQLAFASITGHRHENASKIGIPNPSYNEGKTKQKALLYNAIRSSSLFMEVC
jgi:hypothetical protein